MKKLTAGIFATILGVTAMGAADAAVTSKGYVDAAVGTVAQSVTDLGTTVAGHTTQINTLNTNAANHATKTEVEAVQGNVDTLAGKVGTIPSTATATTVVGYVDEKTSGIATDATVNALSEKVTALETASATHAIKTEVDAALAGKADAQATANALELKADKTAIANMATTSDVAAALQTAQDYADANDADTVYNDAEVRGLISGNTTLIQGLETSKADKTAIANMATTSDVATALQTAKDYADTNDADTVYNDAEVRGLISGNTTAITTLQEFDNSIKTATEGSVDGTYTLTMKKTGDVMTFGWELIQRDGTLN